MKFEFEITRKPAIWILIAGLVLGGILAVSAYNTSYNNVATQGAVVGHSADEVVVQMNDGSNTLRTVQDLLKDGVSGGGGSGSGFLVSASGFIAPSGSVNLGSDWDLVMLAGQYLDTDAGAAGGFVSNQNGTLKANLYSGTSGHVEGDLSAQRCAGSGSNALCAQVSGGNLTVTTGSIIQVEYVVLKSGPASPSSGSGSYTIVPTFPATIKCPTDGTFYNNGDGSGAAQDLQFKCSGGYVVAFANGSNTPVNTTDNLPRCSNAAWTYSSEGNGNDITFSCQSSGGYVTAMCNNDFPCPANAATMYAAGSGVYCNWAGYRGYSAQGGLDSSIDCESNHVVGIFHEGQTPPTYVQAYTLVPQ